MRRIALVIAGLSLILGGLGCDDGAQTMELTDHSRPIINGLPPDEPMHDAVVSLHQRSGNSWYPNIFCSGTLIAPDVVLTAAHCLDVGYWSEVLMAPEDLVVYVGDNPVNDPSPELHIVSETWFHPQFDSYYLVNDIGLIRLSSPSAVTPVPALPQSEGFTSSDEGSLTLNFAGFGEDESGNYDIKLQLDGTLGSIYSSSQIYYQQSAGGPCFGDSGGPAFVERNGTAYVGGMTSYGNQYCTQYGISTRADYFEQDINDFVGVPTPFCGDGTCDASEDCTSCAADCGACPPVCGDGTCDPSEDCTTCAADCGTCPPVCGDGTCEGGEDCASCAADCGACLPVCGDGTCEGGEDCVSCAADCGACPPVCGDGTCEGGEDCVSCAADCGACPPVCGDGTCEGGEDCVSCAADCGACPPTCGDGTCDAGEDCANCAADCGACPPVCGDGTCEAPEDCASCATDCGVCPPVCGDGTCDVGEDCAGCPADCGTCGGTEVTLATDDFEDGWNGGSGWAGAWTHTGDNRIEGRTDHYVRLRRSTGDIRRTVSTAGVTALKLTFWARLRSLEKSDRADVKVSVDGGNTWITVQSWLKNDDDNQWHAYEIDLAGLGSPTSLVVRFDANMSGRGDYFYIDDVAVLGVQ